jgi:hypothetical protein
MRFARLHRKIAGGCKFAPRSCTSLALRMRAAPVCKVGAGTGFARAASVGALGRNRTQGL